MALAIKKILLKKGINAAGKSGFGFIFDGRDNLNYNISAIFFILIIGVIYGEVFGLCWTDIDIIEINVFFGMD